MPEDGLPSRIQDLPSRSVWPLLVAGAWFGLAAAMVLWPNALGRPDSSCASSDDAGIMCFILQSWGTPLGIGISVVCGVLTFWGFLNPGVSAHPESVKKADSQPSNAGVSGAIRTIFLSLILFLVCGLLWILAMVFAYPFFN